MRFSLLSTILLLVVQGWSLPSGYDVKKGSATLQVENTNAMQIQTEKNSILHWQDFSIKEGESVTFKQPDNLSSVLNRVIGSNLSELYGSLLSNGKVYVINPNGVVIGPNAKIETASFVASSLDVLDEDFLKGKDLFFQGEASRDIINYGMISCPFGNVFLLGRNIKNDGEIKADKIGWGSALEILIKPEEDESVWIKKTFSEDEITIENNGLLQSVTTELKGGYSPYLHAIKNSGKINVFSTEEKEGRLFLKSDQGGVQLKGKLETNEKPINVDISAKKIDLFPDFKMSLALKSKWQMIAEQITNEADLQIPSGEVFIQSLNDRYGSFLNEGIIDVSSKIGGSIELEIDILTQAGKLIASGDDLAGNIKISTTKNFIETTSGEIEASSTFSSGGNIEILCREGRLFSSGKHTAFGINGGKIILHGKEIALCAATVDATGVENGGEVLIGGDLRGENPEIFNSEKTYINAATNIKADGVNLGSGGKIIVWSEEKTHFSGNISARGCFKGGGVEVSSKDQLSHKGSINVDAVDITGEILLDPLDITISTTGSLPYVSLYDPNRVPLSEQRFGQTRLLLNNGRILVTKPDDDTHGLNSGAVYLYDVQTGGLIGIFAGANAGDGVGHSAILLSNGNFVVASSGWSNGATSNVGAVTFFRVDDNITGSPNTSNSLHGTSLDDRVGNFQLVALTNGNYVVGSPNWNLDVANTDVGAVTWCNGNNGYPVGASSKGAPVTVDNSLHGSQINDYVGNGYIVPLTNNNFVVCSPNWANGLQTRAGAVTLMNGATGYPVVVNTPPENIFLVTTTNSLHGTNMQDYVGEQGGTYALPNGNYVVVSSSWNIYMGAVTWGDGVNGTVGPLSGTGPNGNSVTGTTSGTALTGDRVGLNKIQILSNGDYVVISPYWNNGIPGQRIGAVTWVNGSNGWPYAATGPYTQVSGTNSLIGVLVNDRVGSSNQGVWPLNNGHYVVGSKDWNGGRGAATWCNSDGSIVGFVGVANSLTGTVGGDQVGASITPLNNTNGDYVVNSPFWNGAGSDRGAATFCTGIAPTSATVATTNSLYGTHDLDRVGSGSTALANGNYVVLSPFWDNGGSTANGKGAATWCNSSGIPYGEASVGVPVTTSNSLYGNAVDKVGTSAFAISNGHYLVISRSWSTATMNYVGALTWCDGTTGYAGLVTVDNSLYGGRNGSSIGTEVYELSNGHLVIRSDDFGTPTLDLPGGYTWMRGDRNTSGNAVPFSIAGYRDAAGDPIGPVVSNDTYFTGYLMPEEEGEVVVGLNWPFDVPFDFGENYNFNVASEFVAASLKQGYNLTLRANRDITFVNGFDATGGGIGNATFMAKRDIYVNDTLNIGGSSLSLLADQNIYVNNALQGTGGTLTLQPGSGYHTASPTKIPDGILFVNADITNPGGIVNFSPAGRSDIMSIATIIANPPGGTLNVSCGRFAMGQNEAMTALCNLNILATSKAKLSDIVALDSLVVSSPNISILKHWYGPILDENGNLYETDATHFYARPVAPVFTGTVSTSGNGMEPRILAVTNYTRTQFNDKLHFGSYVLNYDIPYFAAIVANNEIALATTGQLQRSMPLYAGEMYSYNMEWIWQVLIGERFVELFIIKEKIDETSKREVLRYLSYLFYRSFIFENEVK